MWKRAILSFFDGFEECDVTVVPYKKIFICIENNGKYDTIAIHYYVGEN
jgi:hypothetical protein